MSRQVIVDPNKVLEMMKEGTTREEILDHYGLPSSQKRNIFSHPLLKNKRVSSKPMFQFGEESSQEQEETITSTAPVPVSSDEGDIEMEEVGHIEMNDSDISYDTVDVSTLTETFSGVSEESYIRDPYVHNTPEVESEFEDDNLPF